MNSPTARLLTVLELLQSYKRISGTELARRLEVDGRTVRRYITMLQDMGIPVEAERGPHGSYQLRRGYKLPPLMFTDTEAIALTMGLLTIREYHFPVDVAAVEGALAKTERVMPEKLLHQARALQETIAFAVSPAPTNFQSNFVTILSSAAHQRQQVHLKYQAFSGQESERDFDPYGIVVNEGFWYTSGYCHKAQSLRTFRLDRILGLELNDASFERPADFDVLAHVHSSLAMMPGVTEVKVIMETTLERAKEYITPMMGTLEETDRGILFRRAAYQLDWIYHVLLSADFPVHIIQPEELKDMLRQASRRALQMVGDLKYEGDGSNS
jgi:predicted DNA-binding transcriptional regulator YafY